MRFTTAEKRALEKHVGEMLNDFGADDLESPEGVRQIEEDRKLLRSAVDKLRASLRKARK